MIKFHCNKCGKGVKAPDKYAGKKVKCPSCQASNLLPSNEDLEAYEVEEVKEDYYEGVFCQHCGNKMKKEAVLCPKCGCRNKLNKKEESEVATSSIVLAYGLSFFFPIGGIIAGIYLCFKNKVVHGIACILLSIFVGIPLGMAFMAMGA